MASGWAKDGAVQEQIDASIADAVKHARSRLPRGESLTQCEECDAEIPPARQRAVPGVRLCIECQREFDEARTFNAGYNRRGSKGSQMK